MLNRVTVKLLNGADLVVRDRQSSNPYVVLTLGIKKFQTRVIGQNLNPVWNEEFVFPITDTSRCLLKIVVRSRNLLFPDDFMGEAEVDLSQLVNGVKGWKQVKIVLPQSRENCFYKDSYITQAADGKRVQEVCLKLRKVDSGIVAMQIEYDADAAKDKTPLPAEKIDWLNRSWNLESGFGKEKTVFPTSKENCFLKYS